MSTLRSLGAQFALDDFAVAFSSFLYPKQPPVDDYLKFDGNFIANLPGCSRSTGSTMYWAYVCPPPSIYDVVPQLGVG
jgi:EAL domain-containing protein (putative c-di-GMP-specific phosphodiesterase class I)